MRWIICCAGKMSRWKNHLGVPKHLILINNQTLIQRSVNLITKHDPKPNILIITLDDDKRYRIKGSELIKMNVPDKKEHFKTLPLKSVLKYSAKDDRTLVTFGDIYFTENCIKTIVNTCTKLNKEEIRFFGRESASKITGCKWGELWGVSYSAESVEKIEQCTNYLEKLYNSKQIRRLKHWELYRYLNDISLTKHEINENFTEINDFTEDFDFPQDYDKWIVRYTKYKKAQKVKAAFNLLKI